MGGGVGTNGIGALGVLRISQTILFGTEPESLESLEELSRWPPLPGLRIQIVYRRVEPPLARAMGWPLGLLAVQKGCVLLPQAPLPHSPLSLRASCLGCPVLFRS